MTKIYTLEQGSNGRGAGSTVDLAEIGLCRQSCWLVV